MTWLYLSLDALSFGSLLFLLAAGLSMIFGVMRIVNLAHGSYYLLGSYLGLTLFQYTGSFVLAAIGASLTVALIGVAMEVMLLRHFQHRELEQVLLTFGFLFIFADAALWIWGGMPLFMDKPALLAHSLELGDRAYPVYRLFLILFGLLLALLLWWLQERTLVGASIRAAVDDAQMASAIGIRVPRLRILVFGFGALLAGLGGVVAGPLMGAFPGADLEVLLLSFAVVIIGGLGSLKGALIGALLVGGVDTVTKYFAPEFAMFSIFFPMAALLAFRPSGIFGRVDVITHSGSSGGDMHSPWQGGVNSARNRLVFAALVSTMLLLAAWPALVPGFYVNLMTTAFIWAMAAFGLNIVLGYAGLPSLGHAAFFAIGAYVAAVFSKDSGWSMPLALMVGTVAAAATAAVFGFLVLRARAAYFMLLTMALSLVVWAVAFRWRTMTGGDDGLRGVIRIDSWGVPFSTAQGFYYFVGTTLALVAIAVAHLMRTKFGYAIIGCRDNERRMTALGYDVWRYQYVAWVLSGTITGLAGGLFAFHNGVVTPSTAAVSSSASMLIMSILGGTNVLLGPVIGAIAITFLENLVSSLTEHWSLVLGLLYIFVVVFAPNGLSGVVRSASRKAAK